MSETSAPDRGKTGLKRWLAGFPSRDAVRNDGSYLHFGRRSFSRRIDTAGGAFVKKTFVRTGEAREAFRAERAAMERLKGLPWVSPWRDSGSRWYMRDYFGPERRLDRVVAAADARRRDDLAAAVAGVIRDLHCRGLAHRDLHALNVFVTDEGLRVIDFETCAPYPPERQPGLSASYDVTGEGLDSPYHTSRMCFDHPTSQHCFQRVFRMRFADALRLFLDRVDPAQVKDELRTASLAFAAESSRPPERGRDDQQLR